MTEPDKTSKLKELLFVECCHTTGMHDPQHRYICYYQKAKAFDRICETLGVDPKVRSQEGCGWCPTDAKDRWQGKAEWENASK